MTSHKVFLASVFQAVEIALHENRDLLNRIDPDQPNHGDQMVEIFQSAVQAAKDNEDANLGVALEFAGARLQNRQADDLANTYGQGLIQMAGQFQQRKISLEELVIFVKQAVDSKAKQGEMVSSAKSGEVLKALVSGLANWQRADRGEKPAASPMDMGMLFDFGIAYLQAKQQSSDRTAILSRAAVSLSPLGKSEVRSLSGQIAFQALLKAIQDLSLP